MTNKPKMRDAFALPDRGAPGATSAPTEPIRMTVDLEPGLHTDVFGWAGAQLGTAGVKVDVANAVRDLLGALTAQDDQGQALRTYVIDRARERAAERRANRRRSK